MDVCCECYVLSDSLCDELITRPEEYHCLWCIVVCNLETSWMRGPWPIGDCHAKNKQTMQLRNFSQLVRCLQQTVLYDRLWDSLVPRVDTRLSPFGGGQYCAHCPPKLLRCFRLLSSNTESHYVQLVREFLYSVHKDSARTSQRTKVWLFFDVGKSVHHHTIQIN